MKKTATTLAVVFLRAIFVTGLVLATPLKNVDAKADGYVYSEVAYEVAHLDRPSSPATYRIVSRAFPVDRFVFCEPILALILGGLLIIIGILGRRQFLKR